MSRVVGYARVSTEGQGDNGHGLAAQRDAILARYPEAEIVEERKSGGRVSNRPALREVLAGLRRGDTLVVARVDRLSRSLLDFAGLLDRARRGGWTLAALDLGIATDTPQGEAMASMLATFAQFERRLISLRTREACEAKHPELRQRRRRILDLARRGLSQRAIAREIGTHKETVARVLRNPA